MSDPDPQDDPKTDRARAAVRRGPGKRAKRTRFGLATLILLMAVPMGIMALMLRPEGIALPDLARARVASGLTASLPPGAMVRLGETRLRINALGRPVVLMQNVRLIDQAGRQVAVVPRVVTSLHRQALLAGRIEPARVVLNGLTMTVARDPDGQFLLSLGSGGQLPPVQGLGDVVSLLDQTMNQPRLAGLEAMSLSDLTLNITDATAARAVVVDQGTFDLTRTASGLDARLSLQLQDPNAGRVTRDPRASRRQTASHIRAGLVIPNGSQAAQLDLTIADLSPRLIAAQSPALQGFGVLDAPVSVALRGALDDQGVVAALSGTVDIGAGLVRLGGAPAAVDRLKAYVKLDAATDSLLIDSLELRSAPVSLDLTGRLRLASLPATGQAMGQATGQPASLAALAQVQISDLALDLPADLAAAPPGPVTIDRMQADLRYDLGSGRLDFGQISAQVQGATAQISGHALQSEAGLTLSLDGALRDIGFEQALSLWPPALIAATRRWLAANLAEASVPRLDFAVRLQPGARPNVALSADYTNGRLSFLPDMPDLTNGSGFFSLNGTRFALSIDQGTILADGAAMSAAGTVFSVDDTSFRPGQGRVALQIAGPVRGALALLARDPVNMALDSLPISGRAAFTADIAFPLGKDRDPKDVTWLAQGTLNQVVGDGLLPGRELRASQLAVTASPESVSLQGQVRVQGVPARIALSRALGAAGSGQSGVQITGTLDLSAETLERFGVALNAVSIAGSAPASFTLTVGTGGAPRLRLTSALQGATVAIPALGWRKAQDSRADLALDVTLASPVQVTAVSLSGAGLQAEGAVTLRPDGSLDRATFPQVRLDDWLDVAAEFTGRGPGQPAALALTGGRLDLRGFSARSSPAGPQTARGPITVALDRLQVADTINVTNLRGQIAAGSALSGSFTGQANGRAPIRADLVANQGRTGLRVRAEDAGAALAALGVLRNGRGGALDLVLQSRSGAAVSQIWDGQLRIENLVVENAPALAGLLSAISVVGILEQMGNGGLSFAESYVDLTLSPDGIALANGRANGPSMGITFEGLVSPARDQLDLQGVISPLNILNGIGGALFARRGEGLFGFSYRLAGPLRSPQTQVNPLSILTPGLFRDLFRREPPALQ